MMEKAADLECLLKCLAAVDADHADAALPQALLIVHEYAEKLYEELANQ